MTYTSIEGIKRANLRNHGHWFDKDTLRFFKSRILPTVYHGKYFISSERYSSDTMRRYTIRVADENGSIDTVGEFQAYRTRYAAIKAIGNVENRK